MKTQKAAAAKPVDNRSLPTVLRHLREARVSTDAPIAAFVAQMGRDPYRVLTACILSLRTKDEVTVEAAARLFELAPDLGALATASVAKVKRAIYPVGFYPTKAARLVALAQRIEREFAGEIPDDLDTLLLLDGVGRKTANLVVTVAFGKPGICVDTHVHRISNRWGYVLTADADRTERALRAKLPARYWIEFNDLLVAWGQTICRPVSPLCSQCRVARWCPAIDVGTKR